MMGVLHTLVNQGRVVKGLYPSVSTPPTKESVAYPSQKGRSRPPTVRSGWIIIKAKVLVRKIGADLGLD